MTSSLGRKARLFHRMHCRVNSVALKYAPMEGGKKPRHLLWWLNDRLASQWVPEWTEKSLAYWEARWGDTK